MAGMLEFGLTARDFIRLRKFFKKSPKLFNRAGRNYINELAFGSRRESIRIIHEDMTVRNPKFVARSVWVNPQRGDPPLKDAKSELGSVRRERFTGWIEQELGRQSPRKRQPTLEARRGAEAKQMFGGARMKPGRQIPSPNKRTRSNWDYGSTPQFSRAQVMLMALAREGYRGPFIIEDHPAFPRGMYRFKGRKKGRRAVRLLQLFTVRKPRPRRVRWLGGGINRFVRKRGVREIWGKAVRDALPKRLR
jgi:hypothetical protein